MLVRVHATAPRSRANGPGTRFVVWLQGCSLACPGCFNPATHPSIGPATDVRVLLDELSVDARAGSVSGLTLSGGEPMQQAPAAIELLLGARRLGLSTLMFSGFARDEIASQPLGPAVLAHLDVLVDGRYRAPDRLGVGLRGSANQQIHLLSARHTRDELDAVPVAEIVISPTGTVILTGVDPLSRRALQRP